MNSTIRFGIRLVHNRPGINLCQEGQLLEQLVSVTAIVLEGSSLQVDRIQGFVEDTKHTNFLPVRQLRVSHPELFKKGEVVESEFSVAVVGIGCG